MSVLSALRGAGSVFRRYPLVRDMTLFGSLFVGAEFSQQTLLKKVWKVDKDSKYDLAALARFAAFGVAFYPLIYYNWYRFLDRRWPGTAYSAVTKKVLVDQFILEPPLICAFYMGMNIMEGKEDIYKEVKAKFLPTFAVGCVFWMPAMAVNFYFLPLSMRVGFVGVCTFVWDNFLCWLKRKEIQPSDQSHPSLQQQISDQRTSKAEELSSIEQPFKSEARVTEEQQPLLWKDETLLSDQQCSTYLSHRKTNLIPT